MHAQASDWLAGTAISIAVIHHLSSEARRVAAVQVLRRPHAPSSCHPLPPVCPSCKSARVNEREGATQASPCALPTSFRERALGTSLAPKRMRGVLRRQPQGQAGGRKRRQGRAWPKAAHCLPHSNRQAQAFLRFCSPCLRGGGWAQEILRILRPGGRMLLYNWAYEQTGRRKGFHRTHALSYAHAHSCACPCMF